MDNGLTLRALNYETIITFIKMKDSEEKIDNISLGFRTFSDYLEYSPYFDDHVGRVAGRIADGQFEIDGNSYNIDQNERTNNLDEGKLNFSKRS